MEFSQFTSKLTFNFLEILLLGYITLLKSDTCKTKYPVEKMTKYFCGTNA